jgi:hypothetical protein
MRDLNDIAEGESANQPGQRAPHMGYSAMHLSHIPSLSASDYGWRYASIVHGAALSGVLTMSMSMTPTESEDQNHDQGSHLASDVIGLEMRCK